MPDPDLRDYLLRTRDFWGQYRTQKENAMWLLTVPYLAAVLGPGSFVADRSLCPPLRTPRHNGAPRIDALSVCPSSGRRDGVFPV